MASATIAQLHDNLDDYLRKAESGEEVIVTNGGRPMARIGPVSAANGHNLQSIADGEIIPAKEPWDPQAILRMKIPVSDADVVGALLEEREESY